ncbi:hypothetical protein L3X38_035125 [Prunus dulcis]|uniref:Hydroxyproline-rich glycoprotein family protein n=1 Tax=Prunus dulcis TaxID=3755 RepID=A0AAD4VK47_PRUDU|nr:hypothetical protein L3X38_035125 [Prunus dulcis]
MLNTGNPELPQKSQDENKFFSRLLSKESSMANPSFKVYYGGLAGSVPFIWESQPGTPKHTFSDDPIPPLTPPPSYYSNSFQKPTKKHSRSNLLHTLFPKISLNKKTHVPSSPSSHSSPSSSLFSSSDSSMHVPVSTRKFHGRRSRFSSRSSSFDSTGDFEEEEDAGSPTSTLCFRFSRVTSGRNRGCH